jgi:hypothetical protein
MSLLLGDGVNSDFNRWLFSYIVNAHSERETDEWMQVYPNDWNTKISSQFSFKKSNSGLDNGTFSDDAIEMYQRINFRFNDKKYAAFKNTFIPPKVQVFQVDKEIAGSIQGTVVPSHFWNNSDEFIQNGAGFCIIINNEPISTAFSSFVHGNLLEIGVETMEQHRGFGFAQLTCMHLIDFCLEHDCVPIWSCRFENSNSYNLAIRLGFEPVLTMPYYRLVRQ